VSAFAISTLQSEAATTTPTTFYDSLVDENSSAEVWLQYEIIVGLNREYTLENLSDCQTLTGNTVSPVGAGGVGRIKVSDGATSQIIKCDTRVTSGGTIRDFTEYSEGTISRYLYDQVEPLFDATPDVDYYSTYNHTTGTYTRNAACWAASIDLSCVAVASNDGSGWFWQRGGTLITSRHILIARHYAYGVGTQVRFSNAAGTVETRTVIGTSAASVAGDLWVCTLSAAVTIASPCAIAGEWINQGLEYIGNSVYWYSGGIIIHTSQSAKVWTATLGSPENKCGSIVGNVSINGTSFPQFRHSAVCLHSDGATPSEFSSMCHTPINGDSGQPVFIIIEGEPVLLWCWHSANSGPPVYQDNGAILNALIEAADTNANASTGLTVTVAPDPTL
jgi:hypothetical protein